MLELLVGIIVIVRVEDPIRPTDPGAVVTVVVNHRRLGAGHKWGPPVSALGAILEHIVGISYPRLGQPLGSDHIAVAGGGFLIVVDNSDKQRPHQQYSHHN